MIPGYHTSIRQHENQILLNVESISRVQGSLTVLQVLRGLNPGRNDYWQRDFQRLIVGRTVMTTYNCKTYRVDDVDFDSNPSDKFTTRRGETTYIQYYKEVSLLLFIFSLKKSVLSLIQKFVPPLNKSYHFVRNLLMHLHISELCNNYSRCETTALDI